MSVHSIVIGVLLVLCALTLLTHAQWAALDFDEGYNMQIPLHLAQTGSYATYDQVHDPKITTGWPVLAAAALLINTESPDVSVRYVTLVYSVLLILLVGVFLLKTTAQRMVFLAGTFVVPLFYLFATSLLGEIPALTLTVAALILWSRKHYFVAGILMAMAVMTKQTYALVVVAMLIEAVISQVKYSKPMARQTGWIPFIGAFLCMHGLWALYQMVTVGSFANYLQLVNAAADWARSQTSPRPDLIQSKLHMISQILHIDSTILLGMSTLAAYQSLRMWATYTIRVLSILMVGWMIYILTLGATAWYRHLFPPLSILLIVMAHHVQYLKGASINSKYILLLILPVALSIQSLVFHNPLDHFAYLTRAQNLLFLDHRNRPYLRPKQILLHQQQAASFIKSIPHAQVIAGLGWYNTPQLAYLANRRISRDPTRADYVIVDIYARYLNEQGVEDFMKKYPFKSLVFENPSYAIYMTSQVSSCRLTEE
jgi:hypothetical protein